MDLSSTNKLSFSFQIETADFMILMPRMAHNSFMHCFQLEQQFHMTSGSELEKTVTVE